MAWLKQARSKLAAAGISQPPFLAYCILGSWVALLGKLFICHDANTACLLGKGVFDARTLLAFAAKILWHQ